MVAQRLTLRASAGPGWLEKEAQAGRAQGREDLLHCRPRSRDLERQAPPPAPSPRLPPQKIIHSQGGVPDPARGQVGPPAHFGSFWKQLEISM